MVRVSAAALSRLLVLALALAMAAGDADARSRRHHHRGRHHHAHVSKSHHRGHHAARPTSRASDAQGDAARVDYLRAVVAERCSGFRVVAETRRDEQPEPRSTEEIRWRALFEKEPETACKAAKLLLYGRGGG